MTARAERTAAKVDATAPPTEAEGARRPCGGATDDGTSPRAGGTVTGAGLDRVRGDAVFFLGQHFPQDVSGVAGAFFDYVLASLRTLSVGDVFGVQPCADGSFVHDFKGQQSCPACGMEGIRG